MADCSELSKTITQLAMNIGADPEVKGDLESVLARMNQYFPEIRRQDIVDAIVEATAGQSREVDDLTKKLRAIRQEARTEKGLQRKIEELTQYLETGTLPQGRKVKDSGTEAIQALREIRDELKKQVSKSEPAQIQRIKKQISELDERIQTGNIFPKVKDKPTVKSKALVDLEYKVYRQKQEIRQKLYAMKPKKVWGIVFDAFNAARAIMTGGELSGVLRQGGWIGMAHPIRLLKEFPDMFKAMASDKNQWDIHNQIYARPNAPLYWKANLYLAPIDPTAELSKMEETFLSHWINKIPLIGMSQRAYVTFLNKLRADSFDAMAASLSIDGQVTEEQAKAIANYINKATGRGGLGSLEKASVPLGTLFFSPRYTVSRFQLLAGQPFYHAKGARKLIAEEYAKSLIGIGIVLLIGKAAGGIVEWDPRSPDFGKIRFGKTRIDLLTGLSQSIVFVSRLLSGETKNQKGKILPIRGEDVPVVELTAKDVSVNFLRSKLAPLPATIADVIFGENIIGEPVTPESIAENLLIPITYGDIYDAMKEQDLPDGVAMSILAFFGAGVTTYEKKKGKR